MKAKDKKIAELEREVRKILKECHEFEEKNGKIDAFEMVNYLRKIETGIALTAEEAKRYKELMNYADMSSRIGHIKREIKLRQRAQKTKDNMTDAEKREYYLKGMRGAAEKKKRAAAAAKAKEELNKDEKLNKKIMEY